MQKDSRNTEHLLHIGVSSWAPVMEWGAVLTFKKFTLLQGRREIKQMYPLGCPDQVQTKPYTLKEERLQPLKVGGVQEEETDIGLEGWVKHTRGHPRWKVQCEQRGKVGKFGDK